MKLLRIIYAIPLTLAIAMLMAPALIFFGEHRLKAIGEKLAELIQSFVE